MLFCQVHDYKSPAEVNSFLTSNQHTAEYIIHLRRINIRGVVIYAYSSPIAAPPVPSAIHSYNPPLTPSAYADSDLPVPAPSPMEMSSPPLMHSPAARQSPATSDSPFTPSSKLFYCQYFGCSQGSNRRRDLNRHVESVHEGKKYRCRIPDCTKVYTRGYTLRKHEKEKHSRKNH